MHNVHALININWMAALADAAPLATDMHVHDYCYVASYLWYLICISVITHAFVLYKHVSHITTLISGHYIIDNPCVLCIMKSSA